MKSMLEKSIDLGLGLFAYSREKIETLVEEMVSKGELERKEAQQFASDLIKRGEEERDELKKLVHGEVTKVLNLVNVARKDDIVSKEEIGQIVREQVLQALKDQGLAKEDPGK